MTQGQILGIIGGTGSGKSSLVQLIPWTLSSRQGSIDLIEMDLVPRNLEQWRYWIAYVPQKSNSLRGTIRSNLTLGLDQEVSDQKLWQALGIAASQGFCPVKRKDLDALVEAGGGRNFSGGQNKGCPSHEQFCAGDSFLIPR